MNIGICGKMASGKTYLAEFLQNAYDFKRMSLAAEVKNVAYHLFKMPKDQKDRRLLQQIGMKMREIKGSVWIDFLVEEAEGFYNDIVVDDVRFLNEVKTLKDAGWFLVKLDVADELQVERLKATYPDDWETHVSNRNDSSESEVDTIPDEYFNLIITAENTKTPKILIEQMIRPYMPAPP